MESSLSKLELDAVLQLIQLGADVRLVCVNFPARKDHNNSCKEDEEGSVGDALSSSVIIDSDKCEEEEEEQPLPRIKPRYGSLLDIYRRTQPPISNRAGKRARY